MILESVKLFGTVKILDSANGKKILGENIFYVKMGPTGGAKGYSKITGQRSSGICYYINDKLIPELTVERGQTYTFVVETGGSTSDPAR